MKVFLVGQKVLRFLGNRHCDNFHPGVRRSEYPVEIKFPPNFPAKLRPTIVPLAPDETAEERNIQVELFIHKRRHNRSLSAPPTVKLITGRRHPVFDHIWAMCPQRKATLLVYVTDFGEVSDSDENGTEKEKGNWTHQGIRIGRSSFRRLSGETSRPLDFIGKCDQEIKSTQILDAWEAGKTFEGVFSIFLVILELPYDLFPDQDDHFARIKKVLGQTTETDLELVAKGSKTTIKCHRAILSMSSPLLAHHLQLRPTESCVRFMSHLGESCIDAFLAFISYNDVTKVFSSMEMTIQVLLAALDFHVFSLVSRIGEYLDLKENDQFTADQVIQLHTMLKFTRYEPSRDETGECSDDHVSYGVSADGKQIRKRKSVDDDDTERGQRKIICNGERGGISGAAARFYGRNINQEDDDLSDFKTHPFTLVFNVVEQKIFEGINERVAQLMGWFLVNKEDAIWKSAANEGLTGRYTKLCTRIEFEFLKLAHIKSIEEKPRSCENEFCFMYSRK